MVRSAVARRLRNLTVVYKVVRATLGSFLVLRFGLHARNRILLRKIRPPYVLLPNHVSYWDPVFVGFFVPDLVYYVTSDRQFRGKLWGRLLSLVGTIPKSKEISDFETVRSIFSVKKKGGVIGIFPEGRRNWDGHSLPPLYVTAKLLRALRLPVIVPIIKGAFLALPRWSDTPKKGKVTVDFQMGFTPEDLGRMSVDEIYQKIGSLLEYDEYSHQRKNMIRYRGRNRAQGLELAIFVCQACNEIGRLRSRGNSFACDACAHTVSVTEYGFFSLNSRFESVREWNIWQLSRLEEVVTASDDDSPILVDGPVWIYKGYRSDAMIDRELGTLSLFRSRVIFEGKSGSTTEFPISSIAGVNVQTHEEMEFYHGGLLVHFQFVEPVSGYKWMMAINTLRGVNIFAVPAAI